MKKCTKCGDKKLIYSYVFNYEGTKVPVILCKRCTHTLITSLLDLVDHRYYKSMLEKFGSVFLSK